MNDRKQKIQDLERGAKDRAADIKIFGEDFVNHYKFKSANGVRYNVCTIDDMFKYFQN
jgi:hypothetical protein